MRLAVKSPVPLGSAGCRSPPQHTREGTFWRAAGTLPGPLPSPRQRKDPQESPKNHLSTGGGRMLLGSGREDSPRRGCPSPGGAGSAPRGGSRVLTEYSPVLTSAGAARSGAEGGARSRGRCPHPAAPTLYARPRALIGQAASRQVTSPNSPRIPRTPPTPPISGTPPKLGVRDPPPRASPEGRRPGGQGEAQGGRGGPGGSCRGVRGWGGVPVPPVGSSPGRASRAKRAGCLGKPAPPRSLQSRYGQDLKGAGPAPR